MSRRMPVASFPARADLRAPAAVVRSRHSGDALDGLSEIELWLAQTAPEVDALVAKLAPRCMGGAGVAADAGSAIRLERPGVSIEQELRIAAGLHDLSAALVGAARLAAAALAALARPGTGETNGR